LEKRYIRMGRNRHSDSDLISPLLTPSGFENDAAVARDRYE